MKKIIFLFSLILVACSSGPAAPLEIQAITQAPVELPATSISTLGVPGPTLVVSNTVTIPAGPIGLVALGDSLTQGDGDDTGRGYTGRLLDIVNTIRPESIMVNLGQSGWSSDALINGDQGLDGQLPRALKDLTAMKDDGIQVIALVWIGSNDLWYLYEYGGDVNEEGEAQDLKRFESNINQVVQQLTEEGAVVIIAKLDDQSKRPVAVKGEAFVSITSEELLRMSVHVKKYNAIIDQVASSYGAATVDFYTSEIFSSPEMLADDGNHPNSLGYDAIAEKWFEALLPILK